MQSTEYSSDSKMARTPQLICTFQLMFSFLYKKDVDDLTCWVELENDQFRYQKAMGLHCPLTAMCLLR